jgi:hypothetical protein
MLEVICVGSLFLSINVCSNTNSIDLAFIDTKEISNVVQPNILLDETYLADNEREEESKSIIDILIENADEKNSDDRDAEQRRRELENAEEESRDYDRSDDSESESDSESDYRREADEARDRYEREQQDIIYEENNDDRDAEQRRRELENTEEEFRDYDRSDDSESDYRREADDARNRIGN